MASYNRVVLMGNVTRNLELRYTAGGLAVVDMGMAVNDRRKTKDGDWVDETCFVDVTLFGRTAEVASEYLSKGSPVFIEGRLKFDSWEKDGQKRSKLSVVCDRMQLLGSREGGGPTRGPGSGSSAREGASSSAASASATSRVAESSRSMAGVDPGGDGVGRVEPEHVQSGRGEAAPTGDGAGYDDADIPF